MQTFKNITCQQAFGTSDEEARKFGFDSWIDYCHKKNPLTKLIKACPVCKQSFSDDNYAVGGHVLAAFSEKNGKPILDTECITPICNNCNLTANSNLKYFNVKKLYLIQKPS